MMSLEVIQHVNNEIARRAARHNLVPYVPSGPDEVDGWRNLPFEFPNIGYHEPAGWELVESWFVDKYEVGQDWEPAITHRRLRKILRAYIAENPTHGFAVTEEGEFQVVASAFRPVEE
jgi:hypothetical protein